MLAAASGKSNPATHKAQNIEDERPDDHGNQTLNDTEEMSASILQAPPNGDVDLQGRFMAGIIAKSVIAVAIAWVRMYTRACVSICLYVHHQNFLKTSMWLWAAEHTNLFAVFLMRLSIALFFLRLVPPKKRYIWTIWGIIGILAVSDIYVSIDFFFECIPIRKVWLPHTSGLCAVRNAMKELELWVGIVCGSIPTLRPLFLQWQKRASKEPSETPLELSSYKHRAHKVNRDPNSQSLVAKSKPSPGPSTSEELIVPPETAMTSSWKMPHRHLCGPMYARVVVHRLLEDPITGEKPVHFDDDVEDERMTDNYDSIDENLLGERETSYKELCNLVHQILVRDMDRRSFERGSYHFPKVDPCHKFTCDGRGNMGKRHHDGNKRMCGEWNVNNLYGFHTLKHQIAAVKVLGSSYLECYRANDDDGPEGKLWCEIRETQEDKNKTPQEVKSILNNIQYHMEQLFAADRYLKIIKIEPPFSQRCCDFNDHENEGYYLWYPDQMGEENRLAEFRSLIRDRYDVLFPEPVGIGVGNYFCAGMFYFVKALDLSNLPAYSITGKLDMLVRTLMDEVEILTETALRDQRVVDVQQRVLTAYSKDILLPVRIKPLSHQISTAEDEVFPVELQSVVDEEDSNP
ncbi:MAG: hypothetical protein Q9209_001068 [Squamulea sp. 1 TL-2023]